MEEYLNKLNESQREAVEYNEGPSLVIAGAGSGKTRVLTYKIAYLVHLGLAPQSILALTFTNKAAREMKERIAAITGDQTARRLWMGTFHSIFSRILRYEAEHIGYPSNFTIYDTTDSKSLLKAIIKEMQLDDKVYRLGMVQSRISNAKNALVTWKAYEQSKELMHMVDLLTFNGRTIVMFVVVLVGEVWVYFLYEIIVLNIVLLLAMRKHEQMCATFYK